MHVQCPNVGETDGTIRIGRSRFLEMSAILGCQEGGLGASGSAAKRYAGLQRWARYEYVHHF